MRHASVLQLFNNRFLKLKRSCLGRRADVVSGKNRIYAALKDICRRFLIVGRHLFGFKGKNNRLRFSGSEQPALGKRPQLPRRLIQLSLGRRRINLNDLLSRSAARIFNYRFNAYGIIRDRKGIFTAEGRVGKSVAKWVKHPFGGSGNGFKISVADKNILAVFNVYAGIVIKRRGRVILIAFSPGINRFTGGIYFSEKNIR